MTNPINPAHVAATQHADVARTPEELTAADTVARDVAFDDAAQTGAVKNPLSTPHKPDRDVMPWAQHLVAEYAQLSNARKRTHFLNDIAAHSPGDTAFSAESLYFWLKVHSDSRGNLHAFAGDQVKSEVLKSVVATDDAVKPLDAVREAFENDQAFSDYGISRRSRTMLAHSILSALTDSPHDVATWAPPHTATDTPDNQAVSTRLLHNKTPEKTVPAFTSFAKATRFVFDYMMKNTGTRRNTAGQIEQKKAYTKLHVQSYLDAAVKAAPHFKEGLADDAFVTMFKEADQNDIKLRPDTHFAFESSYALNRRPNRDVMTYYKNRSFSYAFASKTSNADAKDYWSRYETMLRGVADTGGKVFIPEHVSKTFSYFPEWQSEITLQRKKTELERTKAMQDVTETAEASDRETLKDAVHHQPSQSTKNASKPFVDTLKITPSKIADFVVSQVSLYHKRYDPENKKLDQAMAKQPAPFEKIPMDRDLTNDLSIIGAQKRAFETIGDVPATSRAGTRKKRLGQYFSAYLENAASYYYPATWNNVFKYGTGQSDNRNFFRDEPGHSSYVKPVERVSNAFADNFITPLRTLHERALGWLSRNL